MINDNAAEINNNNNAFWKGKMAITILLNACCPLVYRAIGNMYLIPIVNGYLLKLSVFGMSPPPIENMSFTTSCLLVGMMSVRYRRFM